MTPQRADRSRPSGQRRRRPFWRAALLVAVAAAPAIAWSRPAAAQDAHGAGVAPPERAVMLERLSGVEHAPDAATVRAWGPRGARMLMELGLDERVATHARVRAVHSLRAFGTQPAVRLYLRAFAAAPGRTLFLQRAALEALVAGFDDVAAVARFLRDARAEVRDGAAWALAQSRSAAARSALAAALASERDPVVRATLQSVAAPAVETPQ